MYPGKRKISLATGMRKATIATLAFVRTSTAAWLGAYFRRILPIRATPKAISAAAPCAIVALHTPGAFAVQPTLASDGTCQRRQILGLATKVVIHWPVER